MSALFSRKQHKETSGVIVLADGTVFYGRGFGAEGSAVGEICFNTSMTGYQEILTDPSYASEIITFTFPHIGNVGANAEDIESLHPAAKGLIVREDVTAPSNWRAVEGLDLWLKKNNLVGISGIDTRALTRHIRDNGAPNGVIAHSADGQFDLDALKAQAADWAGLEGMDLAQEVTCQEAYEWDEIRWELGRGYGTATDTSLHVVAMDFGVKRNILRCLASAGCRVTVVPAQTTAQQILDLNPDGVFLSNGPGDPAATGEYAVPTIKGLLEADMPIFGICLGHQMLARALGATTSKMHLGHRGGNHPVKDLETGKVEITSQNHGFQVMADSLEGQVEQTHVSLFDGSNEGIKVSGKPVFSVQYHPEASPGPQDSHYLFDRFVDNMKTAKAERKAA